MGLPAIHVSFKKLASTARTRSARGILCIVVQDDTKEFDMRAYLHAEEVKSDEYTAENYAAIARAFAAAPYRILVVRVGTSDSIIDAEVILDTLTYNWLCAVPAAFQTGVVAYVKKKNVASRVRKIKALVAAQSSVDDAHIVSVYNTTVTISADNTPLAMVLYLPRLAAVLAACPMTESVTNYALSDLSDVSAITDIDATINAGNLCLYKDDDTNRIARGVNTLQTLSDTATESMKKITVVEAMDMIQEDIIRTFKESFLGKMKNTADNQALFISNVTDYFKALETEGVLYPSDPAVQIDVPSMRNAWSSVGVDTTEKADAQVKLMPFRSTLFVTATIRILDALEDLSFSIAMTD